MEYWNEGDRAYAFWDEDEYFYPATIVTIDGEDIYVRFDTGEEEWTNADYLDPYEVEEDEEVECKSKEDNMYYDVTVIGVDGDQVQVEYEDGSTEWANLDRIRFFIEEVEEE